MKILLSAVACDPSGGSEGGVGWNAACTIARSHEVFVLTHSQARANWEQARDKNLIPSNINVRFLGRDADWHPNRFIARLQSWQRFLHFNSLVLEESRRWHSEVSFDLAHQVTYATWRVPSPLWKLDIPFVWGPVGGAGVIPSAFRSVLDRNARFFEIARDVQSWRALRSQAFLDCVRNSAAVLAANSETRSLLAPFRQPESIRILPVAYLSLEKINRFQKRDSHDSRPVGRKLQLFAGGNIMGSKGVSLALEALALVKREGLDFHYTVAGGGPAKENLQRMAKTLGIDEHVTFHPGFHGDEYVKALHDSDVYFLPSLRETTPVTMQEAMLAGCVPVVADTSAAGEIARSMGGVAVPAESMEGLIQGLAEAIIGLDKTPGRPAQMGRQCSRDVAEGFSEIRYRETLEEVYRSLL